MTVHDMRAHAWLSGIEWDKIYRKTVSPPYFPHPNSAKASISKEDAIKFKQLHFQPSYITDSEQYLFRK